MFRKTMTHPSQLFVTQNTKRQMTAENVLRERQKMHAWPGLEVTAGETSEWFRDAGRPKT